MSACLTLVVYAFIATFILTSTIRYFTQPLTVVDAEIDSEMPKTLVPPLVVSLRFLGSGESAYHPELFAVEFIQSTIRQQDKLPRILTRLNISFDCGHVGNFAKKYGNVVCPDPKGLQPYMQGTYEMPEFSYLALRFRRCNQALDHVTCKPANQSDAIALSANINVVWVETRPGEHYGQTQTKEKTVWTRFNPLFSEFIDLYMQRSVIQWDSRYVFDTGRLESFISLKEEDKKFSMQDFSAPEVSYGDWFFRLAQTEVNGHRIGEPLLDLLGSWGAFWSFIAALSIGRIAAEYNRRRAERYISNICNEYGMDRRALRRDDFMNQGRLTQEALVRLNAVKSKHYQFVGAGDGVHDDNDDEIPAPATPTDVVELEESESHGQETAALLPGAGTTPTS